jgi:hypothetical protein
VTSTERSAKPISTGKKLVFRLLLPLVTLVLGLVVVEAGLHWLAEHLYGMGKLFQPDGVTSWRYLPGLDLVRKNADGASWRIVTDELGFRETGTWHPGARRRLLILGDSLAFGDHEADNAALIRAAYDRLCSLGGIGCLVVNEVVERDKRMSPHILRDGHRNRAGNAAFAGQLLPLF